MPKPVQSKSTKPKAKKDRKPKAEESRPKRVVYPAPPPPPPKPRRRTSKERAATWLAHNEIKIRKFLAAYAECGVVGRALKAAGIGNTNAHSIWMRTVKDYRKRFLAAVEEAADNLEAEARRRAVKGLIRYKFFKGEPILHPETKEPYYEIEYSDTLLIFLLKAMRPEKYREQMDQYHHHDGVIGVTALRQEILSDPKYLDYCRQQSKDASTLVTETIEANSTPAEDLETGEEAGEKATETGEADPISIALSGKEDKE